MAIQLKGLDAQVLHLSSMLAVRTLQLEMEHIFGSLEAEALDFFNGVQQGGKPLTCMGRPDCGGRAPRLGKGRADSVMLSPNV